MLFKFRGNLDFLQKMFYNIFTDGLEVAFEMQSIEKVRGVEAIDDVIASPTLCYHAKNNVNESSLESGKGQCLMTFTPFQLPTSPSKQLSTQHGAVSVASPFKWKLLIIVGTVPTIFYVKVGLFKIALKRTN